MSAAKKSKTKSVVTVNADKPVLGIGPWSLMVEQRNKALAFDLLVNGGYVSKKKADHALELAKSI